MDPRSFFENALARNLNVCLSLLLNPSETEKSDLVTARFQPFFGAEKTDLPPGRNGAEIKQELSRNRAKVQRVGFEPTNSYEIGS
jgi:hypothetical protein